MTSNNMVNVPLSGTTGSVNFVGATSPTFTTPILGAATATSLTFSPTTDGIVGTTAADNAAAGEVGEFISSNILFASAIGVTTSNSPQNLTSISLTAGDWNVWGNITWVPQGSTQSNYGTAGISTTSATFADGSLYFTAECITGTGIIYGTPAPMQRINVSTTTTVYMVGQGGWTVSTMKFCGGIYARRVR